MSDEYNGGCITDEDERSLFPTVAWRVAVWREQTFGIKQGHVYALEAERVLGDDYMSRFREDCLPPGSERSWRRGIWANIPLSYLSPWSDLWVRSRQDWRTLHAP